MDDVQASQQNTVVTKPVSQDMNVMGAEEKNPQNVNTSRSFRLLA
jgi:hypothetical protein